MYGMNPMGNMYGRPMPGGGDPNAPSAWQAMLGGIGSMVHFFGRLSFLVDENAHAVHFFISALLQLLDRFGSLYGELARFILRLLGLRRKESTMDKEASSMQHVENPKTFDAMWQNTMRN
jgi:peroxin-13